MIEHHIIISNTHVEILDKTPTSLYVSQLVEKTIGGYSMYALHKVKISENKILYYITTLSLEHQHDNAELILTGTTTLSNEIDMKYREGKK